MNDPSTNSAHVPSTAEALAAREAKVEELLIAGLDAYLGGQYESAVHLWTRVLFLDRGHARARAYIERARSALAERQRESDELLHHGVEAFDRGEIDEAHDLVTSSMQRGGARDEAAALLDRVDRLRSAIPVSTPVRGTPPRVRRRAAKVAAPATRTWSLPWLIGPVVLAVTALYVAASWDLFEPAALLPRRSTASVTAMPPSEPLPLPSRGELALERARLLFEHGHLHDALAVLNGVEPADPLRGEADRVASAIQRVLLATAVPSASEGPEPLPGSPAGRQ